MNDKDYHYLFMPSDKPLNLLCTGLGYEYAKPNMVWGPASREIYVLHYVLSGKGTLHINNKTIPISKGQMFLIPPNVQAKYTADGTDPWFYCFVNYSASYNTFPEKMYVFRNEQFGEIFSNILHMIKSEHIHAFEINAELYRLFFLVAKSSRTNIEQQQYVSRATAYIHEFYNRQLRISDIAKHLGLDRSYLYSLFLKHIGMSPKEYLTRHRLNVASSLLSSNTHIKNVALACGYSDVYSFSKAFKKQFGCSPSSYVKNESK